MFHGHTAPIGENTPPPSCATLLVKHVSPRTYQNNPHPPWKLHVWEINSPPSSPRICCPLQVPPDLQKGAHPRSLPASAQGSRLCAGLQKENQKWHQKTSSTSHFLTLCCSCYTGYSITIWKIPATSGDASEPTDPQVRHVSTKMPWMAHITTSHPSGWWRGGISIHPLPNKFSS